MKKNYKKISISFVTLSLVGLTAISGLALTAARVSADDVVDNVAITVPVSCTMSGTGMNTHTKEVVNGTYEANIGTTTMKVLCNDNSGFSIYATGFTGDTIAETNSNKLVGTSASGNAVIDTGTATTVGNPDVSNWAMKLTAASGESVSYPLTIQSDTEGSFSSYHTVPNTWTKVATRAAGTDIGTNAEGSTMTTTYAAYISKTQPADTYTGKVKYTLVHPNDGPIPEVPEVLPVVTGGVYVTNIDPSEPFVYIGQTIPEGVTIYNNSADAIDAWNTSGNNPYYLRHILNNNGEVEKSYVEFVITQDMATANPGLTQGTYTLRGGVDENSLTEDNRIIYNTNKKILNKAFGIDRCEDISGDLEDSELYYYCEAYNDNSNKYIYAELGTKGRARVGYINGDFPHCVVEPSYDEYPAYSYCYP